MEEGGKEMEHDDKSEEGIFSDARTRKWRARLWVRGFGSVELMDTRADTCNKEELFEEMVILPLTLNLGKHMTILSPPLSLKFQHPRYHLRYACALFFLS